MRYLRAWLFGAVATAVLASVASSGAVSDIRLAAAGLVLVQVETAAGTTETTIGPALPLLALLGGLLNAAALALVVRRGRGRGPIA